MSCSQCTNDSHTVLNQIWTNNGSLTPTKWGPFTNSTFKEVPRESYCSGCNSSGFATGTNSWSRSANTRHTTTPVGNVLPRGNTAWSACVL